MEFGNCRFGAASEAASRIGNRRDCRIIAADSVEPGLYRLHIKAAASLLERRSWVGSKNVGNDVGLDDFNIVRIIGTQDLQRRVSPVCQSNRAPLGHALAGNSGAVAEGSEIRSELPLAAYILIENIVHDPADGFVNGAAVDKILVVGGAVGDVKRIALISVRRYQPNNMHFYLYFLKNSSGRIAGILDEAKSFMFRVII